MKAPICGGDFPTDEIERSRSGSSQRKDKCKHTRFTWKTLQEIEGKNHGGGGVKSTIMRRYYNGNYR
jgi:hypothetical protein